MENKYKGLSWSIVKSVFLPILLLAVAIWGKISYRLRIAPLLPASSQETMEKIAKTVFVLCVFYIIQKFVDGILIWYKDTIAPRTATELDDELVPFVRRIVRVLVWAIALLIILPFYGINTTSLVALFGVTSLAVSLAAQDTIANIISGFMIMVDRPFKMGDTIKLPTGEKVEVISIGIRRSKFLAEDSSVIIVPNMNLSKSKITNYSYKKE